MSLENFNIQSGDEYADLLIENLRGYDEFNSSLPDDLMKYWEDGVRKLCNERYSLYMKGKIDSYLLTDDDMLNTYKEASLKMTGDILAELVEKGEVKMGINENGEIVYSSKDWEMIKRNKKNRRK